MKKSSLLICGVLLLAACHQEGGNNNSKPDTTTDAVSETSKDDGQSEALDDGRSDGASEATTDAESESDDTDDADSDIKNFSIGSVTGPCGVLDDEEWLSDAPFIYINTLDLGDAGYDISLLSEKGQYIANAENAGGSSVPSEAIAFEMLHLCEGATFLKDEVEVIYDQKEGGITDILVEIDGRKVGVSVTRAFAYQREYTLEDAEKILKKKLTALPIAMSNANEVDRWEKSILSVLAYDANSAAQIKAAFDIASAELKGDAIVMVTVSDGDDSALY